MKIGIWAMLVHPARIGGAESYARNFLRTLEEVDDANEYTVFVAKGSDYQPKAKNIRLETINAPVENIYLRVIWEHTAVARAMSRANLDLYHFLGSTAPFNFRANSVVTIHDTLRFQQPDLAKGMLSKYYDAIQRNIVRTGKRVISVSHADAEVMKRHLQLADDQLNVVPIGVSEQFFCDGEKSTSQGDYLLWIGRNYPHKNLNTLLEAYSALLKRKPDVPPLWLVGIRDNEQITLDDQLRQLNIGQKVKCMPPVAAKDVPELVRNATLLCFPSVVESFGLPVLEAMASGTAVVCSSLPCFHELYGDTLKYCETFSSGQFADAIQELLENKQARAELERAAQQRARDYTWEKCVRETLEVYKSLKPRA